MSQRLLFLMMKEQEIIKNYLQEANVAGYLLFDYEGKHPLIQKMFPHLHLTRKLFCFFYPNGNFTIIAQELDALLLKKSINHPNELYVYQTWEQMLCLLKDFLSSFKKPFFIDYSDDGLLMPVSLADYGTTKYILSLGHKILSSASLLGLLSSYLSEEEIESQKVASNLLLTIKDEAFAYIKDKLQSQKEVNEYEVQQLILRRFKEENLYTDEPPIVATGQNARSPHYAPNKNCFSLIQKEDLVLIDMWAKRNMPRAVYGDITWMAYCGKNIPSEIQNRFQIIRQASDECFAFIKNNYGKKKIYGYQADDITRNVITKAGWGKYFTHRTGHSIAYDNSPHGCGTNLDNFETHDTRELLPNTSFSIEPGIYAYDFGMRLETDITIIKNVPTIVAGRQKEIIKLL